jgi:hypothetical protein
MTQEFSQAQIMLSLSLLSYRGFWDTRVENRSAMADSIRGGLAGFRPLQDDWTLVWGPGTYRYLGSVFDSAMMYVVRHRHLPARYVIVVRGTNPVDLFDWLFGDFLPHRQVPWHPVDNGLAAGARVSLSTALGLKILLNMRAENVPEKLAQPGKFDFLIDLGDRALATTRDAADRLADDSTAYDRIRRLSGRLLRYQRLWGIAEWLTGRVGTAMGDMLRLESIARMISLRQRLIRALDDSLERFAEVPVAMLSPGLEELAGKQLPGIGLLELLGNLAAIHGDGLELFVTGHSKGGALAPALALFLNDTQRNEEIPVRRHYRWNPGSRAAIHCYAFAGPTPGNTAFAEYFNRHLGRRFYRYANQMDIVTHAWQSDRLRRLADIYGESVTPLPGLTPVFGEMADEVERLDYTHPGLDYPVTDAPGNRVEKHVIEFTGPMQADTTSYLLQALYQHVEAYIDLLGLGKLLDLGELLGLGGSQGDS